MFNSNGVYIVERPDDLSIYQFVRDRYFDICEELNLLSCGTPEHFESYVDLFGDSIVAPLLLISPYDDPRIFLEIHYRFAKWLDSDYNVRYYDFVKSYYDSLKDSK